MTPDGLMTPILVLGTPRSGTSLTAGLLHRLGVWVGECRPPDRWNRRGYFENDALKALCWERRWRELRGQVVAVPDVEAVLLSQGWRGGPWLYKHAPYKVDHWEAFEPVRVKVWRDPEAVLRSRLAKGHDPEVAAKAIARHNALLRGMDGIDFRPETVIRGDDSELRRVAAHCGLAFDPKVLDFVEAGLWHH